LADKVATRLVKPIEHFNQLIFLDAVERHDPWFVNL